MLLVPLSTQVIADDPIEERQTAKEYEILIAISKVSVRVATRRNCIEVTDLIGFF